MISNDAREADYAAAIFESLGIEKSRLIMERRSRNTIENAEFSKALVAPKPGERWLLVTSAYHMPRSVGLFRKAGFAVEPYPVDWRVGETRRPFRVRQRRRSTGWGETDIAMREWMGLIAYRVTGQNRRVASGARSALERRRNRQSVGLELTQTARARSADLGVYAMQQQTPPEQFDLAGMAADLNSLLRLKTTVIGIKMFAAVEEMMAIPKIRRPSAVHTTDQIVSMASRLGWTVGITADDLVGAQCRAVIGLAPQDEKWLAGENYVGVWHGTAEDARKRQEALDVVPFGQISGDGGEPADQRPAQSAGHLPGLCDAGPDDHPDQRAAIYRLQEVRMGRGRRDRLRGFMGAGAEDRRALACRCHALPSGAMAACRTRRC